MRERLISLPVTATKLAEALEMKPFKVLALLVRREIFVSPVQEIDFTVAREIAAAHGVDLRLPPGEDGGEPLPPAPSPPPSPPMTDATLHRPVGFENLAQVLGWKPHQLLAALIQWEILDWDPGSISEKAAIRLAATAGVTLHIADADGGADIPAVPAPEAPVLPPDHPLASFLKHLEAGVPLPPDARTQAPPVSWRNPVGPDPDSLSPDDS